MKVKFTVAIFRKTTTTTKNFVFIYWPILIQLHINVKYENTAVFPRNFSTTATFHITTSFEYPESAV